MSERENLIPPKKLPHATLAGYSTKQSVADDYDIESGTTIKDENDYLFNAEVATRLGFIRKVYSILSVQLLCSLAFIVLSVTHPGVKAFVQNSPALLFLSVFVSFGVLIAFCFGVGKSYPVNMYLLGLFTLAESYLLATITSHYQTASVLQAIGITAAVTVGLTIYTIQSKRDFSGMGPYLFVALMCLILASFLRLFFPATPFMDTAIAFIAALVFSAFIVYDTHLLLEKLGPDDYIYASLNLYLDIINLFLEILKIIGKKDN